MPVADRLPTPACIAMILASTIVRACTCRKLIPTSVNRLTCAFDITACTHSLP